MNHHEQREATTQASIAKLKEVVKEGEEQGLWKAEYNRTEGASEWRYVDVRTPDGLLFTLTGGSWGREGEITASVSLARGPHGLSVSPRDVRGSAPSASVSHTRTAKSIVKDLARRCVHHTDAIDVAIKVRDALALALKQRADLRWHIAALEGVGYKFNSHSENECYRAEGYRSGKNPRIVTVTYDGKVTFSATVTIDDFLKLNNLSIL